MLSQYLTFGALLALATVGMGCASHSSAECPRLTEAEVLAIALPVLQQRFPATFQNYKPYRARYGDGRWRVWGTLPQNVAGGTPAATIRDGDGHLLRVFHTQ